MGKILFNLIFSEPIRKLQSATHFKEINVQGYTMWTPCTPDEDGAKEMKFSQIDPKRIDIPPITISDFQSCLQKFAPSLDKKDLAEYEEFTKLYGTKE